MTAVTDRNQATFERCQTELDRLITPDRNRFVTAAARKISVPVMNQCLGLNVLTFEEAGAKRSHRAMLDIERTRSVISSKIWAVSHADTYEYLRPGLIHGVGEGVFRQLVDPDQYDGYRITASRAGEVVVAGLIHEGNGQHTEEPLPVFDTTFPESGEAFLMAIEFSLIKRANASELS